MECLKQFIVPTLNYSPDIRYQLNTHVFVCWYLVGILRMRMVCFYVLYQARLMMHFELGFNPFTRACLLDAKVKHHLVVLADGSIDKDTDPQLHILLM